MSIKQLPIESQPREKLINKGPQALTDAELLAIFLRTGIKGLNVIELSDFLLQEFGSLRELFAASQESFCQHKGLGNAKYVQLQAVLEMGRRYLAEDLKNEHVIENSIATKQYLTSILRDYTREVFYVLFLNNQHRLLCGEALFQGTVNRSSVHPREVVKRALELNASAVVLAHNHPSGSAKPSEADKLITTKLMNTLALVDVKVLDHIIVGEGEVSSFSELGLIHPN